MNSRKYYTLTFILLNLRVPLRVLRLSIVVLTRSVWCSQIRSELVFRA
jgi:hypothetical protein